MAILSKANMVHLGSLPCYHRHLSYSDIYSYSYSNSHSSLVPVSRPSFPRCTLRISPLQSSFGKNVIKSTLSALRMESTQLNKMWRKLSYFTPCIQFLKLIKLGCIHHGQWYFSGQVTKITHAADGSSWTLLDVYKDHVLAVSSSPNTPGRLRAGKCSSSFGMGGAWRWSDIHNPFIQYPEKVMEGVSLLYFEVLKIPVCTSATTDLLVEGPMQPFEAVFIGLKSIEDLSKSQQKPPMVVLIHGGPHSAFTTSFSMASSFLALLGFNLLLVNYRGSVGFGEEALQSLPGHAGSQDVADVLASVDFAIGKGLADPGKIALLGGSHGGFLSTHLIGQAPDRFVTAAVLNPVCNLSTMVGTSDIPDWCFVETFGKGGSNRFSEAPSLDDISSFYAASPIAHVNKVKVPTLFLLGAQDRRVPPSNGIQVPYATIIYLDYIILYI